MPIKIVHGGGSFPQPPSTKLFRNIAVTFVLITVAVIAIALWTSSVSATVTVKAKRVPISLDTNIDVAAVPASGQIKGQVVSGTFAESNEYDVPVTSSTAPVAVVLTKTTGRVRIVNNNSKSQPLVATTRLLTADGKLYRLTKGVTVPAGGTIDADAASDQAGAQYQIATGVKLTIPGLYEQMQKLVYAESVTPFAMAGSPAAGEHKIVTAELLAKANDALFTAALDRAKQSLGVEAGAPAGWESVYVVTGTQKQSNAAVGQASDKFLAQVKITVTAVYFPREDVAALIRSRLNDKLSEGYSIVDATGSSAGSGPDVTFRLDSADPSKNTARLAVSAEAQSQLSDNSAALRKDLIVGLPSDEVIRKWSALDGVDEVDVDLHPSWVHRLPTMKDKITVIIQ